MHAERITHTYTHRLLTVYPPQGTDFHPKYTGENLTCTVQGLKRSTQYKFRVSDKVMWMPPCVCFCTRVTSMCVCVCVCVCPSDPRVILCAFFIFSFLSSSSASSHWCSFSFRFKKCLQTIQMSFSFNTRSINLGRNTAFYHQRIGCNLTSSETRQFKAIQWVENTVRLY